MNTDWLMTIWGHYNFLAAVIALSGIIAISVLGKRLAFTVPGLAKMRDINRAEDKQKWAKEKYPPMVRSTQNVGKYCNFTFFPFILPFCVTMQSQPWWQVLLDVFIILMFYDFLYYLSHRFWFHGNGKMRQVHAVHHQARNPTYLDAHYVHPFETFVGLALYLGSVALLAALMGPFHVVTIIVTFVIFFQINQINHTFVDLPYFPFKSLSWITAKHHVHHENMHKGNYATITLFYDKIFGTLD
ncbi:MAG: sterol desaturase/sphingolipid hydroxylase (fatty acid hydroxylase superfamily) [Bacteroidia bacterium]|jgi:sterol desaturase/sphingolipid hydroxylase (fatty acid hydroxylase superfamily)